MPRLRRPAVLAPLALLAATAVAVPLALARSGGSLSLSGLEDGVVLGATALSAATVKVLPTGVDADDVTATIDGKPASMSGGAVSLAGLPDGRHVLELTAPGFLRSVSLSRTFEVDSTPPRLEVTVPKKPVRIKQAVELTGTTDAAKVDAVGGVVTQKGTTFTVRFARPPAGATLTATDAAGNVTERKVTVPTAYPTNIRAVHMTGAAWAYSKLRNPVLALIKQKRINAIQLDIKDEDGVVNYASQVPLAKAAKATVPYYELPKVTAQLHKMGVRVIGRIVAFNDTKLTRYAQSRGSTSWYVQKPDGSPYEYGYNKAGFTNFAHPEVRKYNHDLAVEAIKGGFDDVVYDYVRRPDGKITTMRFPGLKGDPRDSIASFLGEAQALIRPLGGSLGAAAFAQAATRSKSTAQDIPKMAKHLDVVIPMEYPSHWNPGEYGVADPYVGARQIVQRSLVDWKKAVRGTNCVVVPWLQDENYKGRYTAAKVREQIQGARDNGIPGWLMWSAVARYTGAAYSPDATPAL